ncbi:ATP-binding protein [Niallia sp. 01092]|uniref:ATP-binding protein n=1 Tax=unclassified Niallia TaxID=2837522 RepID=UPI003FD0D91E
MKIHQLLKSNTFIIFMMIIMVPIAGEFKFFPLQDQFRVSFAPTIFFFLLLFLPQKKIIQAGIITGIAVGIFRMLGDFFFLESYTLEHSFMMRLPACFYYISYSLFFLIWNVKKMQNQVWKIGVFGIILELTSQLIELAIQSTIIGVKLDLSAFMPIGTIAIFRSFFVVSFYSMIVLYEAKIREEEITSKNKHLLLLLSSLYEEKMQVKKTLNNVEKITKDSFELYRSLKNEEITRLEVQHLSQEALKIAGEIHDIKKDNQRIYAGISKLIASENFSEYMYLPDLLEIIISSNNKYAQTLGKKIQFSTEINVSTDKYEVYFLLSILNNLVSNSIEAIKDTGEITVHAYEKTDWLYLEVIDTGLGIEEKYNDLIYKPGFSLKFDDEGISSTGIGLSYSKETIANYGGAISHETIPGKGTKFMVELPKVRLIKE